MKKKKEHLRNWIVIWSYQDSGGYDSGKIEIQAPTRKAAEEKFKQNNRMRVDAKGNDNPRGGFTVEVVMTYDEWNEHGRPTRI